MRNHQEQQQDYQPTMAPPSPPPPPPQDHFLKAHHQHNLHVSKKTNENEGFTSEAHLTTPIVPKVAMVEESGRERLKRHRVEMGGRVWIPDIWGHEDLLKDWIDCTVFDSSLGNNTIVSARTALIQEAGRSTVRIENQC